MNFLSHFYHDEPCNDPYFAAGVIMPDIISNYSYRSGDLTKVHPWQLAPVEDEALVSLTQGVKRHYEIDGYWHESDFFKTNTDAISDHIRQQDFACFNKRLYAFSHVFLELMLDRSILVYSRQTCDHLYALLETVDKAYFQTFLQLNTRSEHPENATAHFVRFRELKFIYDYADNERLTGLLNVINQRFGNDPFTENDKILLYATIHDIQNSIISQKFPKFPSDS